MKAAYITVVLFCCAVLSVAGNITSASASDGHLIGAASVWDNVNGLSGTAVSGGPSGVAIATTISATFASGGTSSCTFVGGTCTTGTGFGLTLTAPSGDTIGSPWVLANNTGDTVTSVTITLGNGAFNPCLSGGSVSTSSVACSGSPTSGAGFGRSISGDGTGIAATVAYTNAVHLLSTPAALGDLYTQVTINFNGTGATAFTTGNTFSFWGDTDMLTGVVNPEPTTVSLVGLALVGLAVFRRRLPR